MSQFASLDIDQYLMQSKHPLSHYAYPSENVGSTFKVAICMNGNRHVKVCAKPEEEHVGFFRRLFCY